MVHARFVAPARLLALKAARDVDDTIPLESRPRPFGGNDADFAKGADESEGYACGLVKAAGKKSDMTIDLRMTATCLLTTTCYSC